MSLGNRRIYQQWSVLHALYRLVDAICIFLSLWIALRYEEYVGFSHLLVIAAATILAHRAVSEISGMYRSWRGTPIEREVTCAALTWICVVPVILALGLLTRYLDGIRRVTLMVWIAITPCTMIVARVFARKLQYWLRERGYNSRRFAICGVNELGFALAQNIENSPEMGLQLLGFYDDRPSERTCEVPEEIGTKIGNIHELVDHARRGGVDIIYITFPMRAEDRIRGVLEALGDTTASVYIVPDFFVFELLHARWTNIGGLPVVSVFENPLYGVDGLLKRTADLVLGTLFLAVAALPMLMIATAIKLSSAGPIFFRQKRYGLGGEEIYVWKFRTMTACENGPVVQQASKDDSRITPIGRILRRTSLDELPQLLNVLAGSMSLVGPRPHATAHNELYRSLIGGYMLRHKVKPGITGLAQVLGFRGGTETLDKMAKRVECDHQYIREWSLGMDLKILLRTFWIVLSRKNAY
ncbi:MAG: undecaprenyl-phosphate glucose phosphotransferase [Pirellulales bacterium]|nr:undecaprenyl-phosphate glucose phosphotransferase [Pirellulales bacterium]